MENVGTGTVCVDKIGETDQTITVIVNGGAYNYSLYCDIINYGIILCNTAP